MVRVAIVVGVVVLLSAFVGTGRAAACSEMPNAYVVTGAVTASSGATVTFRVQEVVEVVADAPAVVPEPGDELAIEYWRDEARFLHLGEHYRVGVIDHGANGLWSTTRPSGDGCGPAWTSLEDGAPLNTGFLGPDGFRAWPATIPAALLGAAAVVAVVLLRRRRSSLRANRS